MLKQILCTALCTLMLAFVPGGADAAPEIIEADGVYMMGDNDTPKNARDAARNEAMRAATEQAGVYIESTSEVQGYALTRDEIRTVAAAILRVLHEEITPELVGGAWRYRVHLVCAVDAEGIDLRALAQNKAEIARLQKERDELKQQNDALLARYERADAAEKPALGAQLAETYKQNAIFDDTAAMILRGETDHAIADLSLLLQDPSVTGDVRAYAYVLRGRAYYNQHSSALALADFTAAERTPHTNSTYPIWRLYEYRGMIHYAAGDYEDAVSDLMSAWDASDKTDNDLRMRLRRAERKAEQERRHAVRGDGGARSWGVVIVP